MFVRATATAAALLFVALPQTASAELSLSKSQLLCKKAAKADVTPTPTKVRVDRSSMATEGSIFTVEIQVKNEAGDWADGTCTVDRESEEVTVSIEA